MKRIRLYKWLALLSGCMFFLCYGAGAQGVFSCRATLDTVKEDGFYKIVLPPKLIAKCRGDLGDLRIAGSGGKPVSYVLKDPSAVAGVLGQWIDLPEGKMQQRDSGNKHSYIVLQYPEAFEIDSLTLTIANPLYYKREARVSAEGTAPGEWALAADITIDPQHRGFRIPTVKAYRLLIDISNEDNSPLLITGVAARQSARYLLAYLQSGTAYYVLGGNPQATRPRYDLSYFTDSMSRAPRELSIDSLQYAYNRELPDVEAITTDHMTTTSHINRPSLLLWVSLFIVLFILTYFSIRMVKAIGKKDTHDRL
jgi:hypothetical protein